MDRRVRQGWEPIEDLPANWRELAAKEMEALSRVWREQRRTLEDRISTREFRERFNREWAIETGIIERVYTLDRGITRVLIERGIDASLIPHGSTDHDPALVAAMIRDHWDALEGLFQFVKGEGVLLTSYIKELHAVLTRHQALSAALEESGQEVEIPLLRGEYKRVPNDPSRPNGSVHRYAPPEQVASEMERLVALHLRHEAEGVPPEVEAAWLHHRFTEIHPFQDGNGRVVRCLASLVFLEAGGFPLLISRDGRDSYIRALERADGGDLGELIRLFVRLERQAYVNALGALPSVSSGARVSEVIESVRESLAQKNTDSRPEWNRARELAASVRAACRRRFEKARDELREKLGALRDGYRFEVREAGPESPESSQYRAETLESTRRLGYAPALGSYRAWNSLELAVKTRAAILCSFHGVGAEFRGVLAASAVFFRWDLEAGSGRNTSEVTPLSEEVFQVNYRDAEAEVLGRFEPWIDAVLARGLEVWRRTL